MPVNSWQDNDLLTNPQAIQVATTETVPYAWDFSALLDLDDVVATPTIIVRKISPRPIEDIANGAVSVDVSGDYVVGTIDGSTLERDGLYQVIVTATLDTGKVLSVITMMECIT